LVKRTAITNGLHTLATVGYNNVGGLEAETLSANGKRFAGQYWSMPGTAWMMHPTAIQTLRDYAHGVQVTHLLKLVLLKLVLCFMCMVSL